MTEYKLSKVDIEVIIFALDVAVENAAMRGLSGRTLKRLRVKFEKVQSGTLEINK